MRAFLAIANLRHRRRWRCLLVLALLAVLVAAAMTVPERARRYAEQTLAETTVAPPMWQRSNSTLCGWRCGSTACT
jgi:hypothetical protein